MAASDEWTDWHLTPAGWKKGDWQTDFNSGDKPIPEDRVLTVRWREYLGYSLGPASRVHEEMWRHSDAALLEKLLKQWGEAPKGLS